MHLCMNRNYTLGHVYTWYMSLQASTTVVPFQKRCNGTTHERKLTPDCFFKTIAVARFVTQTSAHRFAAQSIAGRTRLCPLLLHRRTLRGKKKKKINSLYFPPHLKRNAVPHILPLSFQFPSPFPSPPSSAFILLPFASRSDPSNGDLRLRTSMASDAESLLREKLKVALKDARNLFDEALIDEKEFKDLKHHELRKYKEHLAAITSTSIARPVEAATPEAAHNSTASTPLCTPLKGSIRKELWKSSANVTASPISPTAHALKSHKHENNNVLLVDKDTYNRLTTPPIFRRRSRNKRKIILPCAELQALQGLSEDKSTLS